MARTVSLVWGAVLVLVGAGVLSRIVYDGLVESLPDKAPRNPYFPGLFAVGAIWIGTVRIRRGLRARDAE